VHDETDVEVAAAFVFGSTTPRPFSRRRWPLWLFGGTFICTRPFGGVGTSMVAPSIASPTVTGTSMVRSFPRAG
jgi:hypothetical protein